MFARISELGADLLHFRKVLLPARAVLTDLSTRRSLFISEATQPFLGNMVGTVEHVLQDMLVDRDILSESLNLYMSMVGHRTNQVMKRLTVVSVVFLPLTFLVGVYGMNFEVLPELKWRFGYLLLLGAGGGDRLRHPAHPSGGRACSEDAALQGAVSTMRARRSSFELARRPLARMAGPLISKRTKRSSMYMLMSTPWWQKPSLSDDRQDRAAAGAGQQGGQLGAAAAGTT